MYVPMSIFNPNVLSVSIIFKPHSSKVLLFIFFLYLDRSPILVSMSYIIVKEDLLGFGLFCEPYFFLLMLVACLYV